MVHQELSLCPHSPWREPLCSAPNRRDSGSAKGRRQRRSQRTALARVVDRNEEGALHRKRWSATCRRAITDRRESPGAVAVVGEVLILDEPTSSLGSRDVARLFSVVRALRAKEMAIVYISHFLEEVREVGRRFHGARDGATVGTGRARDAPIADIVSMMAGRAVSELFRGRPGRPGTWSRSPRSRGHDQTRDASLDLRRGEVVGIAGLVGAGRTELARAIFGLDPVKRGIVKVLGVVGPSSPSARVRGGMGFVSEDRKGEGSPWASSIADNVTLSKLDGLGPFGLVLPSRARAVTRIDGSARIHATVPINASASLRWKSAKGRTWRASSTAKRTFSFWTSRRAGSTLRARSDLRAHRFAGLVGQGDSLISSYLPELSGSAIEFAVMRRGFSPGACRRGSDRARRPHRGTGSVIQRCNARLPPFGRRIAPGGAARDSSAKRQTEVDRRERRADPTTVSPPGSRAAGDRRARRSCAYPVASVRTSCSVRSPTAQRRAENPRRITAIRSQIRRARAVARDDENRLAPRGQRIDELVDLSLARNVDPARRLVQKENVRFAVEEARQCGLLLISTGEIADALIGTAGVDAEPSHPMRVRLRARDGRTRPKRSETIELRERDVVGDGEAMASPSPFRSSLTKPIPPRTRAEGDDGPTTPSTLTMPRFTGSRPKIARASSVRPAPTRPAMRPPRHVEDRAMRPRFGRALETADFEDHVPGRPGRPRKELTYRATCHRSRRMSAIGASRALPVPTVAPSRKHRESVGTREPPPGSARCRRWPFPSRVARRTTENRRATSREPRLLVGSSRMRTLADDCDSARGRFSTICLNRPATSRRHALPVKATFFVPVDDPGESSRCDRRCVGPSHEPDRVGSRRAQCSRPR